MESTDEAGLGFFPIGPSTVLGRAVALRVLFCRSAREVALVFLLKAAEYLRKGKWVAMMVVRWLLLGLNPRRPTALLVGVVAMGLILRRARHGSAKAEHAFREKFWKDMMKTALTYEEWAHAAIMIEKQHHRNDSKLYDEELVRAKLNELRLRRLKGGVEDILFCIRADLVRSLGNMCNPELHKERLQTPRLIQEYINEVTYHLREVCETDSEELSLEEKISFVHETRHAFGRTALLLSGGAALGSFHLGVVRTLIEHRLLPRVVAGASVGSILCSFAATRTWPELQSFFDDPSPPVHFFDTMGSIFATVQRLLSRGAVHDIGLLQRKMRQLIGDLTFQEAYDLSGRVLGISVCSPRRHEPPRLLNYLTSPHVVIWSAVTASCAFPFLFEAQELMAKDRQGQLVPYHTLPQVGPEEPSTNKRRWRDGSLESDLPKLQLKELFNVNHYIVSQANPHIAPLLRLKEAVRAYGGDFAGKLAHLAEMEVKHRCSQMLEMGFSMFGLAKLFAQEWEGDVTIVMPATFAQFAKLIQNPNSSDVRKAVMQGRRCTWEKLSAIQANCGIELMLDECVAELNNQRKAQSNAEKSTAHTSTTLGHLSFRKRIPSWNCLARENSWGSLDEEIIDGALKAGGPWGGPSLRKLRPHINLEGSDNEVDSLELTNLSWTKAGGPLMRTASAAKFVLYYESHIDSAKEPAKSEPQSPLSAEDAEGFKLQKERLLRRAKSWDRNSMKNTNKIRDTAVVGVQAGRTRYNRGEDIKGDEGEFSFDLQSTIAKVAGNIMESSSTKLVEGELHHSSVNGKYLNNNLKLFGYGASYDCCESPTACSLPEKNVDVVI